jgi:hypothetical protein
MRRLTLAAALAGTTALAAGCGSSGGPSSTQAVTLHVLSSITDGAVLSDPLAWTAQPVGLANGDVVDRVEFSIDGRVGWTEHKAPYFWLFGHDRR